MLFLPCCSKYRFFKEVVASTMSGPPRSGLPCAENRIGSGPRVMVGWRRRHLAKDGRSHQCRTAAADHHPGLELDDAPLRLRNSINL